MVHLICSTSCEREREREREMGVRVVHFGVCVVADTEANRGAAKVGPGCL